MIRPLGIVGIITFCFVQGCGVDQRAIDVFHDFTLVAFGPASFNDRGTINAEPLPDHGNDAIPMPDSPEVGHQYVFHRLEPVDNEKLADVVLPARLGDIGFFRIETAETQGFFYSIIGGPTFARKFSNGRQELLVFSRVDEALVAHETEWSSEDYVLVVMP